MISIPFESAKDVAKKGPAVKGLDDSDLSRHKIDSKVWEGFFVPPPNQIQTASISRSMLDGEDVEKWYQSLSRSVHWLRSSKKDPLRSRQRAVRLSADIIAT